MLIRRCAWHRQYNGYPMFYGIAAWRQPGLQYTDGMCRRCAVTAMKEWTKDAAAPPRARPLLERLPAYAGRAAITLAAASVLLAIGLTAVTLRTLATREGPVSALPRAAIPGPQMPHEMCVDPATETAAPRS